LTVRPSELKIGGWTAGTPRSSAAAQNSTRSSGCSSAAATQPPTMFGMPMHILVPAVGF
jgi:hypothetical protein